MHTEVESRILGLFELPLVGDCDHVGDDAFLHRAVAIAVVVAVAVAVAVDVAVAAPSKICFVSRLQLVVPTAR